MRAIDADDFENRMYHEVFEKDSEDQKWDSGCWIRYKLFERVLKDQPTIESKRDKSAWIHKGCGYFKCNQCGEHVSTNVYTPAKVSEFFKFCPNCGADMRTEE